MVQICTGAILGSNWCICEPGQRSV